MHYFKPNIFITIITPCLLIAILLQFYNTNGIVFEPFQYLSFV